MQGKIFCDIMIPRRRTDHCRRIQSEQFTRRAVSKKGGTDCKRPHYSGMDDGRGASEKRHMFTDEYFERQLIGLPA